MNSSNVLKEYSVSAISARLHHVDHSRSLSGKATGFVERSILGVVGFMKEALSNDEIASRKGFLQSCDPRFKCASLVVLLVSACVSKSHAALAAYYLLCLLLAAGSSLSLGFFLKRTLLFVPLFSFFIAVPAIFGFITPGKAIVSFRMLSADVSITRQGVDSALIFCFRVLVSVSLSVLLMLTTRQHVLLKVLRMFGVPQLFVMTMSMSFRYIFLLLDSVQKTFLGIKSRVGTAAPAAIHGKIAGAVMSGLWLRSYQLHEQVYKAMLSRGYSGEPRVSSDFRARALDVAFLVFSLCVFLGTLCMNRYFR